MTTPNNTDVAAPKPCLLYCWMWARMEVLVPKKRGSGYLKVPFGHHADDELGHLETVAECDIFGLDGALSFECGAQISSCPDKRTKFEARILPGLQKHYKMDTREVSETEFWRLHPIKSPASPTGFY